MSNDRWEMQIVHGLDSLFVTTYTWRLVRNGVFYAKKHYSDFQYKHICVEDASFLANALGCDIVDKTLEPGEPPREKARKD